MRYLILVLCLCKLQVEAFDWMNRTIRVDLDTNRTALSETVHRQKEYIVHSETTAMNATNGQYPWSIYTLALRRDQFGNWGGIPCTASIISQNFALTDFHCTGQNLPTPATLMEAYVGAARFAFASATVNIRHFWYIEPSHENGPTIVLLRFHEPLTFNPNTHPIRLPASGNFSYEGWATVSMGFTWPFGEFAEQLQFVNTNILSNAACSFPDDHHDMCANEDDRLGLTFFFGGAWVTYEYDDFDYHSTLVGIRRQNIASFGIATRVSHFVEWIEELMAEAKV